MKEMKLGDAWYIVKCALERDIPVADKVEAIRRVAFMETHNSITKDDFVRCLRWLFETFDFEQEKLGWEIRKDGAVIGRGDTGKTYPGEEMIRELTAAGFEIWVDGRRQLTGRNEIEFDYEAEGD